MHLTTHFSFLFVTAFFFYCFPGVAAVPTKRQPRSVTFPIRSLHPRRVPRDIDPGTYLQLHINRAVRRLARMTGRAVPSDDELRARLHKLNINAASTGQTSSSGPPPSTPSAPNSVGISFEAGEVGYTVQVLIGTPQTAYEVILDSGSSDFWVGGEGCVSFDEATGFPTGSNCGNHPLGTSSSSTFIDQQTPFGIFYGTGAVNGTVVRDTVSMAGFTLTGHQFGAASRESTQFAGLNIDGLMGLARGAGSEQHVPTFPESLSKQNLIGSTVVGYKLARSTDSINDGELTLGGLDSSKFDNSTLVNLPVISDRFDLWAVDIAQIQVGGRPLTLQLRSALLDTGTTLILAPPADAEAIHKLIPGAQSDGLGGYAIPCSTSTNVSFLFSTQTFTISPLDLVFNPSGATSGMCVSGIATDTNSDGVDNSQWVLGDGFLRNVYFGTNTDDNSVYIAKLL